MQTYAVKPQDTRTQSLYYRTCFHLKPDVYLSFQASAYHMRALTWKLTANHVTCFGFFCNQNYLLKWYELIDTMFLVVSHVRMSVISKQAWLKVQRSEKNESCSCEQIRVFMCMHDCKLACMHVQWYACSRSSLQSYTRIERSSIGEYRCCMYVHMHVFMFLLRILNPKTCTNTCLAPVNWWTDTSHALVSHHLAR